MAKQTAVDSLRESIRLLEIRQTEERDMVKEQLKMTYESLKLVNLLKSSVKELTSSAELKNGLIETIASIFSGYISKKIMINSKSNAFMKVLGVLLQFGVTSAVAKNADVIRTFFNDLIDRFFKHAPEVPEAEV